VSQKTSRTFLSLSDFQNFWHKHYRVIDQSTAGLFFHLT